MIVKVNARLLDATLSIVLFVAVLPRYLITMPRCILLLLAVALLYTLPCTNAFSLIDLFTTSDSSNAKSTGTAPSQSLPTAAPSLLLQSDLEDLSSLPDDLFALTSPLLSQADSIGQKQLHDLSASTHPLCQSTTSTAALYPLCRQLTDRTKTRIALQLTNCHLARSKLQYYPCAEDEAEEECAAVVGRDAVAYATYTAFYVHVDNICLHVQRQHVQEQTVEVIASLFSAAINTAQQLRQFKHDAHTLSASLLATLTSNYRNITSFITQLAETESKRWSEMKQQADGVREAQLHILTTMSTESAQLSEQISAAHRVGEQVLDRQDELGTRQERMLGRQEEQIHAIGEARQQLSGLRQEQQEAAAAAMDALSSLVSLQEALLTVQQQTRGVVASLSSDIADGFSTAHASLDTLSTSQQRAFDRSEVALSSLLSSHSELLTRQAEMSSRLTAAREEVERLREEERVGFERAEQSIERIAVGAAATEKRLQSILSLVSERVERILALDYTLLGEVFKLSSVLFYACVAVACFFLTSTERTNAARLWVYACMALAVAAERALLSVDSAAVLGRYGDCCFLIRAGLCIVSAAAITLSASVYRDYGQLTYHLQQHNHQLLQHSHTLLTAIQQQLNAALPSPPLYDDTTACTDDVLPAYRELGDEAAEAGTRDEAVNAFVIDERQRLLTEYFQSPQPKPKRRRALHRLSDVKVGSEAAVADETPVSSARSVHRSRSRSARGRNRKTKSSFY